MKKAAVILVLIATVACTSTKKPKADEKWSVKMANSIMHTSDSLINFEAKNDPNAKYNDGHWDYDVAYLGAAIAKLSNVDSVYFKYMQAYIDNYVQADGSVLNYQLEEYNIDRINPAKNLFTLYHATGNEKYKIAIDTFVAQMLTHPKTASGGFWHKKIYPEQMWLDGLFMASPFLAQYAAEFNHPEWFDTIAHQFLLIYDKTYDPETGLLFHAQDESKQQKWADPETGRSKHFWGRSIGWYLMAIVDVMDYMPADYPERETILEHFSNTVEAVLAVRDPESGVWYQILDMPDREGNYLEGSCSAMFTYAIGKAAIKGYLPESYLDTANKCFDAVLQTFITEGSDGYIKMNNICAGAGLGGNPYRDGSFEYYITEEIVVNDCKGVAPFIDAAVLLDR